MASPKSLWLMLVWLLITMGSIIKVSWCLPSCPDNERQALLSFKSGVVNDTTNRLSSWVALPGHDDCCKWKGVGCNNQTGHVVKLDLRNPVTLWYTDDYDDNYDDFFRALDDFNRARLVVRKVNPSLLELKHLNYLDLSMNDFSGINVPNFFGSFHQLRYMNLSWAFFGGVVPHSLGNLSALRSLDLNGIPLNFSLTIPSFPSLLELRLSHSSYDLNPLFHSHLLENLTSLVILDLSDNGFSGPIPNAIRNMSFLQVLDLSYNHFNGSFPKWFYQMKNLKALDLGFNSFTGPIPASSSVAFTSSIETIYMGHNLFNGPLPDWLYLLKNLKTLDLSANGLDGPISTSLGNLSKLEALHLGGNELSGSIPTSLGRLSKLRELYLYNNQLTGPIPMSIGKLSLLTALVLGENHLNGFVPESLGQLSMLTYLNLGNNSLNGVLTEIHFATLFHLIILYLGPNPLSLHLRSGWVPPFQLFWINLAHCDVGPQVPDWLQTQTEMVDITMSNNHITSIPSWFANISSQLQSLDLSHNQIHGKLSNTIFGPRSNLSRLRTLDLSNNSFGGPIPKNIGVMLPDLQFLDISNNHLNGSLPNSLFQMPNLEALDLSRNSLSGSLFSNMSSGIQTIDLRFNRLSGSIPNSIGQLTQLSSLYLSNNNFHGELPPTLQNCSSLSILDVGDNALSGELPTWFGETMLHLKVLRLRSNKYSGSISQKLCRLNRLHILDIAHNHLSGTIPHCFSNFSAMVINITNNYLDDPWSSLDKLTEIIKGRELEYISNLRFLLNIDLSGNNIVGQIPEDLTSLSALTALNLSNNRLTGKIPYTIGRMRSLEALDFSGNQLSGAIPQSISSLSSLSYFNVSCNNLSGAIPTGNQLQTLDDPSIYKSNYALCGYPLKKQCTRDESPVYATSKREEYERDDFKLWLYIGMTSGFVFGFWSFCGALVFKRTWSNGQSSCQRTMSVLLDPAPASQPTEMGSFKRRYLCSKSAPVENNPPAKSGGNDAAGSIFAKFHPSFLQVALALTALYLGVGTLCFFFFFENHIKGHKTNGTLDAIYFCIVTMTTVGYGDLVPNTDATKLLACAFVFIGMALVGLVLSKAAYYLVEKQETLLLDALDLDEGGDQIDVLKEMKTTKVKYKLLIIVALLVVHIIVGTIFLSKVEGYDFVDSFYCVCCTITTLGYGDKSFSTVAGRIFAVFWIVASTICLAQFFLCVAELNTERRQRSLVQLVLKRRVTDKDLEAADSDGNRVVSAAEFIIYKLKEMGQLSQEDIALIMED